MLCALKWRERTRGGCTPRKGDVLPAMLRLFHGLPYPNLLERGPYQTLVRRGEAVSERDRLQPRKAAPALGATQQNRKLAIYFAERGNAAMIQDVRGRQSSPGEFNHFLDEGWGQRQDGYDTVEY